MQVTADGLPGVLTSFPNFSILAELCAAEGACFVGGAVRDALTGRKVSDLDLIFPQDPTPRAQRFARRVGGSWFWLDRERLQSRVVVMHDDGLYCCDFALYRASTLLDDLLDRDFTVNAMALPVSGPLTVDVLVDPCRGLSDLRRGLLRMVHRHAFGDDPLRIIKGVRHATMFDMEIVADTLLAMRAGCEGLRRVAPERIRQEFWKLLQDRRAVRGLTLLAECGAGEELFGVDYVRLLPLMVRRLELIRESWRQAVSAFPPASGWLEDEVEQGLTVETLLLFTLLFSISDKALPSRLAKDWKLSRKACANIAAVSAIGPDVAEEFAAVAMTQRAYAWWAGRYRAEPKLLLLAMVAHGGGQPADAISSWLPLVEPLEGARPADLVDGQWLRDELQLAQGPEMSKALELLRNAEISGDVANREQACDFLRRWRQNRD